MKIIERKIRAHQDNRIRMEDLSWFKLLNIKCNSRAKSLIQQEEREIVPFSFELSSSYLSSKSSNLVLNTKESMLISMLVSRTSKYVSEKLWNSSAFYLVDWVSRGRGVAMLTPMFKVWLSKSFTNFAATSHRMKQ